MTEHLAEYKAEMKRLAQVIEPFKVEVPEGTSGKWKVERFTVPEEPTLAELRHWREGRPVPPGTYTRLSNPRDGTFMSDTPAEMNDARELLWNAHGDILITGLGIGMIPRLLLREDLRSRFCRTGLEIVSVTIVELEQDVINLVAPALAGDDRLQIVHADAFEWDPGNRRFDWAWHDIWPQEPGEDEVPQITALRQHYRPFMRPRGRQLIWLGGQG